MSTNKRLHFELGLIKAIQSLGEVRLSDVIKVLAKGADSLGETSAVTVPAAPVAEAVAEPVAETPPPPAKVWEPEPEAPKPAPKKPGDPITSRFDSMIASAPEVSEPIPADEPPFRAEAPKEAPAPPKETKAAADDSFHHDPLIEHALKALEGRVVK